MNGHRTVYLQCLFYFLISSPYFTPIRMKGLLPLIIGNVLFVFLLLKVYFLQIALHGNTL